jgi:sec-independent protein translocase protein TatC
VILGKLGLVTSSWLREKRRHVFVGLLILAMILTPPDVVTQLLMAVPLMLLYELCVWIVWASERGSAQRSTEP